MLDPTTPEREDFHLALYRAAQLRRAACHAGPLVMTTDHDPVLMGTWLSDQGFAVSLVGQDLIIHGGFCGE